MSQFETSAGYLGYPFENGASKMAVSVRFLCHLPNEEMAIHFSSTISCLIVERISQGGCLCKTEERMKVSGSHVTKLKSFSGTYEGSSQYRGPTKLSLH